MRERWAINFDNQYPCSSNSITLTWDIIECVCVYMCESLSQLAIYCKVSENSLKKLKKTQLETSNGLYAREMF